MIRYTVMMEQTITRRRRAFVEVEATDATAAYKVAREKLRPVDWVEDLDERMDSHTDVHVRADAGWDHSFRDENWGGE